MPTYMHLLGELAKSFRRANEVIARNPGKTRKIFERAARRVVAVQRRTA